MFVSVKTEKANDKKVKKIAKNFSLLLKHHSVPYRKLAKSIDLAHPYLLRLSKGLHANPGFFNLEKIAKFFKISLAQLTGDQEINFKNRPKDLELDFDEE